MHGHSQHMNSFCLSSNVHVKLWDAFNATGFVNKTYKSTYNTAYKITLFPMRRQGGFFSLRIYTCVPKKDMIYL